MNLLTKTNLIIALVFLILIGIIIVLAINQKSSGGGSLSDNLLEQFPWTVKKPPSLKDEVVVYVSSGLFNLYENIYSLGTDVLGDTSSASSILSDHIPSIVQAANAGAKDKSCATDFSSKNCSANFIINTLIPEYLKIPKNGMAGTLSTHDPKLYKKANGWKSYIPARDGFNMAYFLGATQDGQLKEIQKTFPQLTAGMWAQRGSVLLEAVYGFDMFNLNSRCNVCIFNADGIAMDDGSCVEIGLCTSRGYPCVIHRSELTSNFAGGVINPMVAGAASNILTNITHGSIDECVTTMSNILNYITSASDQELDYGSYIPPPKLVSYWCNVGEAVWEWKYTSDPSHYVIRDNGTLDPSSLSDDYTKLLGKADDIGRALVVAKIILLLNDVRKKYHVKLISDAQNMIPSSSIRNVSVAIAESSYANSPLGFTSVMSKQ